tara:strand:- start:2834 stop:3562 length:729 start_codon:yes stop_codon:yes gene_type:complete
MNKMWMLAVVALISSAAYAETENGPGAASASSSKIYRVVDENGNVVFTDQKPGGAAASEEVKLRPTNAVPIKRVELPREEVEQDPVPSEGNFAGYESISISSPEPGSTIRNPQESIKIAVELVPQLQEGHRLVVLDNGNELPGLQLLNPDRGVHTLTAMVVSSEGEVLIQAAPIELYIHRSTAGAYRPGNGTSTIGRQANPGGGASQGGAAPGGGAATPGGGASTGSVAKPASLGRPSVKTR